ncbi:hypothetical protein [Pseudomonas sp. C9-3]|uniref:hypothetical protein n=1 Tax=Pseudomonas sp. C9-3 TaxID=3078264 RepID=UPI0028EA2E0A|nr:hypothetical protein [Pseudomonas sp. C9-3]
MLANRPISELPGNSFASKLAPAKDALPYAGQSRRANNAQALSAVLTVPADESFRFIRPTRVHVGFDALRKKMKIFFIQHCKVCMTVSS